MIDSTEVAGVNVEGTPIGWYVVVYKIDGSEETLFRFDGYERATRVAEVLDGELAADRKF